MLKCLLFTTKFLMLACYLERGLLVWREDAIGIMIDLDKETIWPKIVDAFLDNKRHWNEAVRECNEEAIDVFKMQDPQTFNKIQEEYELKQNQQNVQLEQKMELRSEKWAKVSAMANRKKVAVTQITQYC